MSFGNEVYFIVSSRYVPSILFSIEHGIPFIGLQKEPVLVVINSYLIDFLTPASEIANWSASKQPFLFIFTDLVNNSPSNNSIVVQNFGFLQLTLYSNYTLKYINNNL